MPMRVHMQNFGHAPPMHTPCLFADRASHARAFSTRLRFNPIAFNTSSISYVVGSAHFIWTGFSSLRSYFGTAFSAKFS